ncbi:MAG TPA: type II toxin-antitoxin system HicA family toxin [Candidatus Dormibacteraeota bacterium]|nr:type II toxin-antitoxin system HicA family toxin [Candidatus Dormibacteraeota bacterium]
MASQGGPRRLSCRRLKVKDVIRLISDEGWYQVAQRGSHRQFKHARLKGRVTIAGHLSDELPPRTLRSILKQARMELMR